MRPTLLLTKLHLPPARSGLVHRERLFARISQGLADGKGLTLVSAPAGYGKSVLVAEWLRSLEQDAPRGAPLGAPHTGSRIFWLSLEANDNDPARFLAYLSAAFKQDAIDHALEIKEIGDWSDFQPVELLLTRWVNSLVPAVQDPLILVFDDYHRITEPIVHQIVQFLLQHRPPGLHLVLITREDPPLPLSRLRLMAELTELRANDLSFTPEEATDFIRQTMRLELRPDSVAALTERTEGWIAGLQLAALSLRQKGDVDALLEDLKGSHRYLVDYLMEEVLRAQPADVRQFLCQTALPRQFTAGLCDALTGRNDSASLLRAFEQANLFLIPLDEQRQWFRYHHLFADCLRSELPPTDRPTLYSRAAQWCGEHGQFEDAVEYALASGNPELAADTIEIVLNNPAVWSSGNLSMLESWLNALPEACIQCRPGLQTVAARAFSLLGKFEQAARLLDQAERQLMREPAATPPNNAAPAPTEAGRNLLLAQIGIYRAAILAANGQLAAARTAAGTAMNRLPPGYPHLQARGFDTLAIIEAQTGNLEQAEAHFLETAALARTAGVAYLEINALCETANVRLIQGRLHDAEEICRTALDRQQAPTEDIPPAGLAWSILGDILRERNKLGQAEHAITTGIELAREGGLIDDLQQGHLFLARLKLAQGKPDSARQDFNQAVRMLKAYRLPRLDEVARMLEARIALAFGNWPAASKWARAVEFELQAQSKKCPPEQETLTLARVLLAENRPAAARPLLDAVETNAQTAGRLGTWLEAHVLLALTARQQGHDRESVTLLAEALATAEPQGFVRLFVDEGETMRALLGDCLRQEQRLPMRSYISRLLAAFGPATGNVAGLVAGSAVGNAAGSVAMGSGAGSIAGSAVSPASGSGIASPDLPDPLSPQEVRILRLMAEGASNKTIAESLYISIGTAKWHVHNILEKLSVGSRTQAINRGRELGLTE